MADVFLSYKREDADAVGRIVAALRSGGMSVWWDQDIAPDAPWEATIEEELETAKAVIVAWSAASAASENVKAEARRARTQGKLIQVFLEPCEPPLFFGERQGVNLAGWRGEAGDRHFRLLLEAAQAVAAGKRPPAGAGYAPAKRRRVWPAIAGTLAIAAAAISIVVNSGAVVSWACGLDFLRARCIGAGLVAEPLPPPPTAEEVAAAAQAKLLKQVSGVWGLPGTDGAPACETVLTYSAEQRRGDNFIVLEMDGYRSEGRVASIGEASLFTRTVSPAAEAGTQWELRLEGDRLIQVDALNVATTLVRCGP